MRFAFIEAERVNFPIAALCRLLNVTRQGYYAFRKHSEEPRLRRELSLHERVRALHDASAQRYGSPRVRRALRLEGVHVSKRRVERAMRGMGLVARAHRRFRVTTKSDENHLKLPNVLAREFTATAPNQRWVTDITYVWTTEGWCYVSVLLDLFSRAIVGWALDTTLATRLPLRALEMAVQRRRPATGLLHHSDRGCQYTSSEYRAELAKLGVVVSMSRKGNCWDNAVAESFFSTMKTELTHRQTWSTRLELRNALFEYFEIFYNRQRLHSSLDYKTPAEVERDFGLAKAA